MKRKVEISILIIIFVIAILLIIDFVIAKLDKVPVEDDIEWIEI